MQIYVHISRDKDIARDVKPSDTVKELITLICKELNQEGQEDEFYVYRLSPLYDATKTLGEYGIREHDTVNLGMKLRGGGAKVKEFSSKDSNPPLLNPYDPKLGWRQVGGQLVYYVSPTEAIPASYYPQRDKFFVKYHDRYIWYPEGG